MPDYARIAMWALDFVRAARERPLWARLLFRLVVGKYAYSEFIGLMDALARESLSPYFSYSLETGDWHKNPVPFDWGKEREPLPLKKASEL